MQSTLEYIKERELHENLAASFGGLWDATMRISQSPENCDILMSQLPPGESTPTFLELIEAHNKCVDQKLYVPFGQKKIDPKCAEVFERMNP